jgi:hypothetical protein
MFRPYFGHHQGYTDIVTSLFTHSLDINVERYADYSNWQSPIAENTITVSSSFERFIHRDNSKLEETVIVFSAIGDCQLL